MTVFSVLVMALGVAAMPPSSDASAVATAPPQSAQPATVATTSLLTTSVAKPGDKLICQQQDTLGTRLGGHKICMTTAQWREADIQQRDAVKHAQDKMGLCGEGCGVGAPGGH